MTDETPAGADAGAENESASPERRSVARNTGSLLIAQGITWTLSFVLATVQPRLLGPVAVGELRIAGSLWAVAASVTTFGAQTLITLEMARENLHNDRLRSILGLQGMAYVVAAAATIGYSLIAGYQGTLLLVILILAITPLLGCLLSVGRAVFFGLEQMAWPARVDVITEVVLVASIISVLLAGGQAVAIAATNVLVGALSAFLMLRGARRLTRFSLRPRLTGTVQVGRQAAPFFMLDVASTVYLQSDAVAISLLADERSVGLYAVAETFLGMLIVVPTLLVSALLPALARASSGNPQEALRQVRRGLRMMLLFAVPVGAITFVVSDEIATTLLGSSYSESGPVLAVMGLVMCIMVPNFLVGSYALVVNRQRTWALITVIAIAVSVPLYIRVVPWTEDRYGNGALGAALIFTVTELFILVLAIGLIAPRLPDRHVVVGTVKLLLAGFVAGLASWPFRHMFPVWPAIVAGVAYVLSVLLVRFLDPSERQLIGSGLGRVRMLVARRSRVQ